MSVAITDVRTQISDQPRWWPAVAEPPDSIGVGDGVGKLFQLRYPNVQAGTLTIYFGVPPASAPGSTTYTAQPSAGYTVSATGLITFTTAPAAGNLVATRYQATAFS
ncbi:MAG: hypothetical protein ACREM8_14505, partial [Vulcanimicrobiaceae bacterium]